MSTISDALKKAKQIYFLVELDFNGLKKRYSNIDISIPNSGGDAPFFENKILNDFNIGSTFDISGPKYSIASVSITIANDDRLQDEEVTRRLDGSTGKIYVWCEGLDWTDIDTEGVIFKGVFKKVNHDKAKYPFSLTDQSRYKFNELTGSTIGADTWSAHRTEGGGGSVAGKVQPMVFGDWEKAIPLLCVDTAAFKYIAMLGISKSVDGDYTATTKNVYDKDGSVIAAGNYTFYPGGVDGQGNIIAYFDFTGDQAGNEPLSCSINGLQDGSGLYTGTAGTLIEHPGDMVYYLMDNNSSLLTADIGVESLKTMKAVLPGLKFATIIKTQANTLDIINRILGQCSCAMLTRTGGKLGIMIFDTGATEISRIVGNNDAIGDPIFSKTREGLIVNNLRVQYGFNPTTGQYESDFVLDQGNNAVCKKSFFEYDTEYPQKVLQYPDVRTEANARFLADRFLSIRAFRHDVVNMTVPYWIGWDPQEGDGGLLTLEDGSSADGNGWTNEKCILVEKIFEAKTIRQRWWRIAA